MREALKILVERIDEVSRAIRETNSTVKAYAQLNLPGTITEMTFKQYAPIVLELHEYYSEKIAGLEENASYLNEEKKSLRLLNAEFKSDIAALTVEVERLRGMGNGVGNSMGSGMDNGMGNVVGNGMDNGMGNVVGNGMGSGMGNVVGNGMGNYPSQYRGWTIGRDERGYLRMHKRIGGRLIGRYVGKVWVTEKADKIIDALPIGG